MAMVEHKTEGVGRIDGPTNSTSSGRKETILGPSGKTPTQVGRHLLNAPTLIGRAKA